MRIQSWILSLCCMGLICPSLAGAQTRFGGGHDGGGKGVVAEQSLTAPVLLADHFPPLRSTRQFAPQAEPILLEERFPEIRRHVQEMLSVLGEYGLITELTQGHLRLERPGLQQPTIETALIFHSDIKYFLVKEFPDVPECRALRDNSGVPERHRVFQLACTQGSTTLLLDDDRRGVQALEAEILAQLLIHEGFRRWPIRLATSTIETIIAGGDVLLRRMKAQRNGDRSHLSLAELTTVYDLLLEMQATQMSAQREWRPNVDLSAATIDGGLQIYKIGATSFLTSSGGLVHGDGFRVSDTCETAKESCLSPTAFIGIGARVWEPIQILGGAQVLNSHVFQMDDWSRSSNVFSYTTVIGRNARIVDSSLRNVLQVGESATVSASRINIFNDVLRIPRSRTVDPNTGLFPHPFFAEAEYRRIGTGARIEGSEISTYRLVVEAGGLVEGSQLHFGIPFGIHIGQRASVRRSTVIQGFPDRAVADLKGGEWALFRLGHDAEMVDSLVHLSNDYEQGQRSRLINMKLRARPFDLGSNARWNAPIVRITEGVTVQNKETPLVFLGTASRVYWSAPSVTFERSIDFATVGATCRMGVNSQTRRESGIAGFQLRINSLADLQTCRTTTEPLNPRRYSRFDGYSGYSVPQPFLYD